VIRVYQGTGTGMDYGTGTWYQVLILMPVYTSVRGEILKLQTAT